MRYNNFSLLKKFKNTESAQQSESFLTLLRCFTKASQDSDKRVCEKEQSDDKLCWYGDQSNHFFFNMLDKT